MWKDKILLIDLFYNCDIKAAYRSGNSILFHTINNNLSKNKACINFINNVIIKSIEINCPVYKIECIANNQLVMIYLLKLSFDENGRNYNSFWLLK